jgi:hypothetical protein
MDTKTHQELEIVPVVQPVAVMGLLLDVLPDVQPNAQVAMANGAAIVMGVDRVAVMKHR